MKTGSTATFVKQLEGFTGDARLYRVEPGIDFTAYDTDGIGEKKTTKYVIVSGITGFFVETYIFAANAKGEIISWTELPGSFQGGVNHVRALTLAGYEVINMKTPPRPDYRWVAGVGRELHEPERVPHKLPAPPKVAVLVAGGHRARGGRVRRGAESVVRCRREGD